MAHILLRAPAGTQRRGRGEATLALAPLAIAVVDRRELFEITLDARCKVVDVRFRRRVRVLRSLAHALDHPETSLPPIAPTALERLDTGPAREPRPFCYQNEQSRTDEQHERDQAHVTILEKPLADQPAAPGMHKRSLETKICTPRETRAERSDDSAPTQEVRQ